jgi:hypothetical protein
MNNKFTNLAWGLLVPLMFTLNACEGLFGDTIEEPKTYYFVDSISVTGLKPVNTIFDTLWIDYQLPASLFEYGTSNAVSLDNASLFLQGTIFMLYRFKDTTSFAQKNFDLVVEHGELNMVQVINSSYISYYFEIKYGQPINQNNVKIGLVGKLPAVYGLDLASKIYFGPNRTDYSDYSVTHSKGQILHIFKLPDINSKLFYALPPATQQYFGTYYTYYGINQKQYCFIEFTAI